MLTRSLPNPSPSPLGRATVPGAGAGLIRAGLDRCRETATNGSLRAAIFGVNDGLVSNLSLVMGVAGAAPPREIVLLTGLAGLLAGACSMAGGEFVSMLSQRELLERRAAAPPAADDLGSPRAAAAASFVSFATGALVPLAPFFLAGGWAAVLASALLGALALFLVGAGVSAFTGRSVRTSGARMLAIGGAAATVTFAIGRLVGANVAG
jgi:VIT1/CCC1 family predicted Fe2+/Mn2+ transporter